MIWSSPLRLDQVVFLHAIQERAARKAKELSRVSAVPAMGVECKLDQRALDGDQIDPVGRNDHARTAIRSVRSADGNRCMLVGARDQSHDWRKGKWSTGP